MSKITTGPTEILLYSKSDAHSIKAFLDGAYGYKADIWGCVVDDCLHYKYNVKCPVRSGEELGVVNYRTVIVRNAIKRMWPLCPFYTPSRREYE